MRVGMVCIGVGFIALSRINHLETFFFCFLLVAIGGAFAGYISICVTIVNWFHKKRARAISIASMGFAVGGFVVPAAVWALENGVGGRRVGPAFVFLKIGVLLTSRLVAPRRLRLHHRRLPEDSPQSRPTPRLNLREAIRSRILDAHPRPWSALVIVSAISVHLMSHHERWAFRCLRRASGSWHEACVLGMGVRRYSATTSTSAHGDHLYVHPGAVSCAWLPTAWIWARLRAAAWTGLGGRGPLMQASGPITSGWFLLYDRGYSSLTSRLAQAASLSSRVCCSTTSAAIALLLRMPCSR